MTEATKEIKKILDDLGNKDNYIEEFGYQYKRISLYDSFQLLDYITNLQQENEILRKNAKHNDKVVDKARWNEMLYKQRIDKANELLQRHNEDTGDIYYKYNNRFVKSELKERLSEVLNGSDEK